MLINLTFKPGAFEKIAEANAKSRASYEDLKRVCEEYDKDGFRVIDVGIHGDVWGGGHKFFFKNAEYQTLDIDEKVQPDIVADIREMPFADREFDLIIVHSVIEHVLDGRVDAYNELFRCLRDGGCIVYVIPIYMDREVEPASFVSITEFEEVYADKDVRKKKLPDNTYFIEVRK